MCVVGPCLCSRAVLAGDRDKSEVLVPADTGERRVAGRPVRCGASADGGGGGGGGGGGNRASTVSSSRSIYPATMIRDTANADTMLD